MTRMSTEAQQLLRRALDAYVEGDAPLAAALDDMDDMLDQLHDDFIQAIFESHSSGRLDLQAAVQLAVVGRFYERIGDHAVNIAKRVHYMVTGGHPSGQGALSDDDVDVAAGVDAGGLNAVWVVAVAGVVVALGTALFFFMRERRAMARLDALAGRLGSEVSQRSGSLGSSVDRLGHRGRPGRGP